jgi:hypothetical protein
MNRVDDPSSLLPMKNPRAMLPDFPSLRLGTSMRRFSSARKMKLSRSERYTVVFCLVIFTFLPNSPGTRKSPLSPSPNWFSTALPICAFQMRP